MFVIINTRNWPYDDKTDHKSQRKWSHLRQNCKGLITAPDATQLN